MSKNIKATWKDEKLLFAHIVVCKNSDNFFGVYHRYGSKCGPLITSDNVEGRWEESEVVGNWLEPWLRRRL